MKAENRQLVVNLEVINFFKGSFHPFLFTPWLINSMKIALLGFTVLFLPLSGMSMILNVLIWIELNWYQTST